MSEKKLKVLHAITKLQLGGAQLNTLYTLDNLPGSFKGCLLAGSGGELDKRAKESVRYKARLIPFLVRPVNPLMDAFAFFWAFFYLLSFRPDIVHTHSSKAGIIVRWASFLAGIDVIIHTYHGFGFTPLQNRFARAFFIFAEKITSHITDKLIAVAHANVEKALSEGIGKKEQYSVVRSGIKKELFEKRRPDGGIRGKLSLSRDALLVGNISCFKPQKSLQDYVESCRRLARMGNYYFILVGDGELRPQLEKQVRKAGISERFFMPGFIKESQEVIPYLDIMLHTARFEGLPRVILEAMAGGVPVVSTAVDGVRDVITHGYNGYLVEPGDVDSMVKYSHNLLNSFEKRKEIGLNQKKRFRPEFDIKEMSKTLNRIYIEVGVIILYFLL